MIKGCRSIAEYQFRRWMEEKEFIQDCFTLEVQGNTGVIRDSAGNTLELLYDEKKKSVSVVR